MGKRSDFKRIARDAYDTPGAAVAPLLQHLKPGTVFAEPCAGAGVLMRRLEETGHICSWASDTEPRSLVVDIYDATRVRPRGHFDCFITNPPWDRAILHPIIDNLSRQADTWLLFDADWVHTKQAIPYLPRLRRIVSVGRVKWIEGTTMTGKDNCAWHLFDPFTGPPTIFVGRQMIAPRGTET